MYFIFYYNKKNGNWMGEMAQRAKVLATKVDNLSPIPETHMVEKENLSL